MSRKSRGTWQVFAASVAGSAHLAAGTECQDALRVRRIAKDVLVLTVADGAGSADRSADGSAVASSIAAEYCERILATRGIPQTATVWRQCALGALKTAARGLRDVSRVIAGNGGDASRFATTLSLVVIAGPWILYAGVGDSFVVVERLRSGIHLVVPPSREGQYVNETVFLTSANFVHYAQVSLLWDPDVTGVALSTDGLADAVLERARSRSSGCAPYTVPYLPFFERLFLVARDADSSPRALYAELTRDRYDAVSDDDRTLVCAFRL